MKRHLWIGFGAAVLALAFACEALALDIRLADIVGGGNGTGTGTVGHGIDPSTGGTTPPAFFEISQPNNTNSYHPSSVGFVNGVFIPDGGAGAVTLDSVGHTYSSFPNTDSKSWDMIMDGPNQNSGTALTGIDYNSGSHSMIGFHANKGITFDLQQIAAAHPGLPIANLTAVAGMTHESGGFGTSDWWVFVDGILKQSQANTPGGVGFPVNVPLTPTDHFLTLVSTDAGDNFLLDQIIFGDPTLHLVPEPSAIALGGLCLLALAATSRRFGRRRG
jgi:hypothetical protein